MESGVKTAEEFIRCSVCDAYIKAAEGYTCPRCKRKNICRRHRVAGARDCASCVFEIKSREITQMKQQIRSIRGVLHFCQFAFLLFAIFFIAQKMGLTETVELLQYSIITDNLVYAGAASVVCYLIFFFVLLSQKQQLGELETQMHNEEFRRNVR